MGPYKRLKEPRYLPDILSREEISAVIDTKENDSFCTFFQAVSYAYAISDCLQTGTGVRVSTCAESS